MDPGGWASGGSGPAWWRENARQSRVRADSGAGLTAPVWTFPEVSAQGTVATAWEQYAAASSISLEAPLLTGAVISASVRTCGFTVAMPVPIGRYGQRPSKVLVPWGLMRPMGPMKVQEVHTGGLPIPGMAHGSFPK